MPLSAEDVQLLRKIARRAIDEIQALTSTGSSRVTIELDLSAFHRLQPLRLRDLYRADGMSFAAAILGIRKHTDRTAGTIAPNFECRFARRGHRRDAA